MLTVIVLPALCLVALIAPTLFVTSYPRAPVANAQIVGRWDMTIEDGNGGQYPSWFEVTREGEQLAGRFVGRTGSQRPIKTVEFTESRLSFSLPIQYEPNKTDLKFEAKLSGNQLIEGTTLDRDGRTLKWTAA